MRRVGLSGIHREFTQTDTHCNKQLCPETHKGAEGHKTIPRDLTHTH